MPSVNPVPRTVLLILNEEDYEVYTNGVFYFKAGNQKIELNILHLQKENELLRKELEKFDK